MTGILNTIWFATKLLFFYMSWGAKIRVS